MRTIELSAVRSIPPKEKGNRGLFPSNKMQSVVEYESQLERDLFLLAEHAYDVRYYQHQPIVITYKKKNGKSGKYTPDAYLAFYNGLRVLVEVKYEEDVINATDKERWKWDKAGEWADRHGILFVILTEREIRTERMANVWFTLGSSKYANNDRYLKKLNLLIPKQGARYNDLCIKLAETSTVMIGKAAQIVCYAIWHGLVFVDSFSEKVLSNNTIIRRRRTSTDHPPFRPLWEEFDWRMEEKQDEINESQEVILLKPLSDDKPNINEKYKEIVEHREKIVKGWQNQPSERRTESWRNTYAKKWNLDPSTIYRWVETYEESGKEGLEPGYSKRGGPKKKKNHDDLTKIEFMEIARKLYLGIKLNPDEKKTFKIETKDDAKNYGSLNKALNKLSEICQLHSITPPSRATLHRYIQSNTPASEFDLYKRGKKYHKSHFSPSLASFQGAIMPMQVLQLDNTPPNILVVDSEYREVLGTPYLTAAIDCHSRMITGFELNLSASSSQTILECLVQSIMEKDAYLAYYQPEADWPIHGFPVLILVDNGMDYRSKSVRDFCMKHDIILEFAPLRNPRYKAYIEEWFNALRLGIKDGLEEDGYQPILRRRLENPDLNPEKKAVMTLEEFELWLASWILDDYHFTNPYDDLVPAPAIRWEDVQDGATSIILPTSREPPKDTWARDDLLITIMKKIERTLTDKGVLWEHLYFNNNALQEVYLDRGKCKVTLRLDRRDIRSVWIEIPDKDSIRAKVASGWAATFIEEHGDMPISESAWVSDVRAIRRYYKGRITPHAYKKEKARQRREELTRKSRKDTKRVRRQQEIAQENLRKRIGGKLSHPDMKGETGQPDDSGIDTEKDELMEWAKKFQIDSKKLPEAQKGKHPDARRRRY